MDERSGLLGATEEDGFFCATRCVAPSPLKNEWVVDLSFREMKGQKDDGRTRSSDNPALHTGHCCSSENTCSHLRKNVARRTGGEP